MNRPLRLSAITGAIIALGSIATSSTADPLAPDPAPRPTAADSTSASADAAPFVPAIGGLDFVNPTMANGAWRIDPGARPFLRRLSVSPGYGSLGDNRLYSLRAAYNPNSWLGYELGFGHNPGDAVHALLHTFSATLRHPIPWRLQPYVTGGYGMLMVFPGQTLNADPVTKNTLVYGGGLELYIRDDVAIRAEARQLNVFGADAGDELVTLTYSEATIGLSFYRSLSE